MRFCARFTVAEAVWVESIWLESVMVTAWLVVMTVGAV